MNKDRDNTLCEYSDEESALVKGALSSTGNTEGGKRFHMTLTSKEYSLCDFSMYGDGFDGDEDPSGACGDDCETGEELMAKVFAETDGAPANEEYRMTSDALVTEADGRVIVSYVESSDDGMDQFCEIHFSKKLPGLVTVCRSGMASTTMTIEVGRRHSCVYRTPFMDFEMRVRALRVDNTITEEGGVLRMDYALEIRGAEAHRTIMEIILEEE